MVGDEERSRKPRVTLEKKDNLECNSRGGRGLYSWQSGEGARYPIRWNAPRFGSDEMSPLYENRCLTVGLVQCNCANHRVNVDVKKRCRRA
jgi:hypothetical protein